MIQFIQEGGQTNETYYDYFDKLTELMKAKYPEKKLVFQHDNLVSHKTSHIMKIMQDPAIEMVFSPSHTPEFSAIENTFADMKR